MEDDERRGAIVRRPTLAVTLAGRDAEPGSVRMTARAPGRHDVVRVMAGGARG